MRGVADGDAGSKKSALIPDEAVSPSPLAPRGHGFPLWSILLMTQMAVDGAGLRTVARLAQRLHQAFPQLFPEQPHWTTCRLWLLRLGLYTLLRPKEQASDWIWFVDHEAPAGRQKCLVILGIRRADLPPPGESLSWRQLEPIALAPCNRSNKEVVLQELERSVRLTGAPCAIVSDHGADLKSAVAEFCRRRPQTRPVYDIVHKTACLLKARLERDPEWGRFRTHVASTRRQTVQTELAFLSPAAERSKSRYMNLSPLLDWADRLLTVLRRQPPGVMQYCTAERLEAKLGWLREFQPSLEQWREWWTLTQACVEDLRKEGLTTDAAGRVRQRLASLARSPSGQTLLEELVAFVTEQSQDVPPQQRLPATSEVIESCFGKRKSLAGEPGERGLTGMILSLGAVATQLTEDLVHQALRFVPTKAVYAWLAEHLGSTTQSQRAATTAALKTAQEKPEESLAVST